MGHDQYGVRMDESGRTTLRNRRFLCPFTPFTQAHRHTRTTPLTPVNSPAPTTEGRLYTDQITSTYQAQPYVGSPRQEEQGVPGHVEDQAARVDVQAVRVDDQAVRVADQAA